MTAFSQEVMKVASLPIKDRFTGPGFLRFWGRFVIIAGGEGDA
jgi:hypothetical protein